MTEYKSLSLETKTKFWKKHIGQWQDSGLSQREYCKANNLKESTFTDWKAKHSTSRKSVTRVPSSVVDNFIQSQGHLELIIKDKLALRIPSNFDSQTLQRLLETLGVAL